MRIECRKFLEDYISHTSCDHSTGHAFYQLFKMYSAYEVHCQKDLKPAIDEFFAFLISCPDIPMLKRDYSEPLKLARAKTRNLHRYLESPITIAQKGYSNIVAAIAPKGRRSAILDVGAGLHPKSSIYLAQKLASVTAMDKEFLLSVESLQGMKVRALEQFFTSSTDVEEYDLVSGRFPCSAIVDIVAKCKKAGKPYFLQLCDCKLPRNPNPEKFPVWTWEQVLRPIDPDIKFYNSCAYNVPVSERRMHRLIERHIPEEEQFFSSVATQGQLTQPVSKKVPQQRKAKELGLEDQLEYVRAKVISDDKTYKDKPLELGRAEV